MIRKLRFGRRLAAVTVAAASVAATVAFAPAAGAQTAPATPPIAYVDVSVATVWTSPDSPRPIDAPALTDPVDPEKWLAGMTVDDKRGLTSGNLTQTQVLYGRPVYVVAQQGDWAEVAVPGQATPKNSLGYPGWVPKAQLTSSPGYAAVAENRPFALVNRAPATWLYNDLGRRSKALKISANTRLPELARVGDSVLVFTPGDGAKWLAAGDVTVYDSESDIPRPTGADLVNYAKKFLNVPYLWAGRAGFGFDCSGFTSTVYEANGISIPRDSGPQATFGGGTKVDRADLQAGDLIFYARNNGTGSIYHVAMYIGDQQMIEAYDAATPVRITPVRFNSDYWGAVRYLTSGN
ncbi:C40 family peptidase [Planotetraspora kaengkrachanensis]|uniref:Peptidase P60 n=1 Tax=Planotetraspora kaengkrachanensis TaxID=575193 RepID=A0A8J3LRY9_9ACTN|nr:NlpC/P60 family protein [Planotetraspora kaengkrachanensis]GIG77697.1 peptidase P60 [Planotetraspora kaengkrachanensis]